MYRRAGKERGRHRRRGPRARYGIMDGSSSESTTANPWLLRSLLLLHSIREEKERTLRSMMPARNRHAYM